MRDAWPNARVRKNVSLIRTFHGFKGDKQGTLEFLKLIFRALCLCWDRQTQDLHGIGFFTEVDLWFLCPAECPKYPGFCITRQKKDYPFIEIFHSPEHLHSNCSANAGTLEAYLNVVFEQVANQGRIADPNITKYSVKVLPFNYDVSTYGWV
ncbi:hypothetical protein IFM89_027197 [Coptis chinensis]|uniref:Uncharacterized protein n=1 Tax=Coptis chinensis TaxID=261450 RepID=A0A835I7J6_9MAGN|nr:hypothetical protein IFM89_027197 [Coptis chinensis]